MAEIGEYFIGGFLSERGVPNDDGLGGAEAVDGGVGGDGFVAGLHPEHAVGRNFLAGAAGDALEFGDELRGLGGEGFVFIEERVDHVGRDENTEQKERQGEGPEKKPPTAGAPSGGWGKKSKQQNTDKDVERTGA